MTVWDYESSSSYVEGIVRFTKRKSEDSLRRILKHFKDPQDKFSYIHVAGTNGKGSVCAYIDSMLRKAGRRVGLFTSPHLLTMTERMKVDGEMISPEEFAAVFAELKEYIDVQAEDPRSGIIHPSYFEWIYIMAMIWFSRRHIEYGVIETGLGGRLDATNVIRRPALTVITSISYDHTAILGDTLSEIAFEKAGIIKENVPVICDGDEPEALSVIRQRARELDAPLTIVFSGSGEASAAGGSDEENGDTALVKNILNKGKNIDFYLEEMYHERDNIKKELYKIELHTGARYQAMNSSLAFLAVKTLMRADRRLGAITADSLKAGLYDMYWPGRLDEVLPGVIVDGAHNAGGARCLRESVENMYPGRDIYLVFAVANDKDHAGMAEILCGIPGLRGVVVTRIEGGRATDIHTVSEEFREYLPGDVKLSVDKDMRSALRSGRLMAQAGGILLCAGSLYLAGAVLGFIQKTIN